jgi:hypothetical protein
MIFDADTMELVSESSGLEELPDVFTFDCTKCGFRWRQTYLPEQTDI